MSVRAADQPAIISSEQANALARKHKFRRDFDLQRRLNRALTERHFPPLDEIARHAKSLSTWPASIERARQSLRAAAKEGALLATIGALAQTPNLNADNLRGIAQQLRVILTAAKGLPGKMVRLRKDCTVAQRKIRKARGAPAQAARQLVQRLIPLWEAGTGTKAGYTRDTEGPTYSGAFVTFVGDVISAAGLTIARASIGPAIEHTLRATKR